MVKLSKVDRVQDVGVNKHYKKKSGFFNKPDFLALAIGSFKFNFVYGKKSEAPNFLSPHSPLLSPLISTTFFLLSLTGTRVDAQTTTILEEQFRDNTSFGWTAGAGLNSPKACLTAGNVITPTTGDSIPPCNPNAPIDPLEPLPQGALRLTSNATNQSAFVFYNFPIPATNGLVIEFNYFSYGGTGADGLTFFLFDGDTINPDPGAFGGSLGYAQRIDNLGNPVPGLKAGYLGVGLDEFGNFANDGETRGTGCNPRSPYGTTTATKRRDAVTIRGSSLSPTDRNQGYCYLADSGPLSQGIDVPNAGNRDPAARSVRIVLTPDFKVSVFIDFTGTRNYPAQPSIGPVDLTQAPGQRTPPTTFKFGYASSTGGSTNFHEIRNLLISTINPTPLPDITVAKRSNTPTFVAGEIGEYTLTVTNLGPGPTYGPVTLTDTLPDGFTFEGFQGAGWSCVVDPRTPRIVTCDYVGNGLSLDPSTDPPLAPGESQSVVIKVRVPKTPGVDAVNQANVFTRPERPDALGNNSTENTTPITDIVVSTKGATIIDTNNNGAADPGEGISYSINITNVSSAPVTNAIFSDQIPEGTTYIPGTTKLNGDLLPDAPGNIMPFSGNGAPVNSIGTSTGIIGPLLSANVEFQVRINNPPGVTQIANQGSIFGSPIISQPVLTNPPPPPPPPPPIPPPPPLPPPPPGPTIVPIGASTPRLRLIKEITQVIRGGSLLPGIDFSNPVTDPSEAIIFRNSFATAGIPFQGVATLGNQTVLESGDEIDYTIYFLSDGAEALKNVKICDAIPDGTTFIPDSFGLGSGILLNLGGKETTQTNENFFSPLTPVSAPCTNLNNPNGSVLLKLGDIPNTVPNNAGFVRFRVRVN